MKKLFLLALSVLFVVSCGNTYIDKYEDLCDDAKDLVEDAGSVDELHLVMKHFRADIKNLSLEYPEESELYRSRPGKDEKAAKVYERKIKAYNQVSKAAMAKRFELEKKNK